MVVAFQREDLISVPRPDDGTVLSLESIAHLANNFLGGEIEY